MSWRKAKANCQSRDSKGGFLESLPEPEAPKMDPTNVQAALDSSES